MRGIHPLSSYADRVNGTSTTTEHVLSKGRALQGGLLGAFWKPPSQNPFREPFSEPFLLPHP